MEILLWASLLVVSLYLIVKSANYFTEYSEKFGIAIGLSSFIIGASIVAIGTSLPELVSSLFAVVGSGTTEFVADNIVGSNIANALLILGVGALYVKKNKILEVKTSLINVDLPFFFSSMALFVYFVLDRRITFAEGVFLLIFFFIFLIYTIKSQSKETKREDKEELQDLEKTFEKEEGIELKSKKKSKSKDVPFIKYIVIILASMAVLALSAKYLIDSILTISELLNISSSMLTITVVAVGTSLPEVLTSLAAIRRGNYGIVLGNVFGSNTFNLLLVGGLPALFSTLQVSDVVYVIGIPYLVIGTFIAIFVTFDNKVTKWEGVSLIFLYIVFIAKIVGLI